MSIGSREAFGRGLIAALVFALMLTLGGCGWPGSSDDGEYCDTPQLRRLQVSPATRSLKINTTQQFYATAILSDGSKRDVTGLSAWSVSDTALATISSEGLMLAQAPGNVTATAEFAGLEAQAQVEAHDKVTDALYLFPGSLVLPVEAVGKVRAVTVFNDGTQQNVVGDISATLLNDSGIIIGVDSAGQAVRSDPLLDRFALVKGVIPGNDELVGSFDGVTGTSAVSVTGSVLTSLQVEPLSTSVEVGENVRFSATGVYADGTSLDLTESVFWAVDDPSVAIIGNTLIDKGEATGVAKGAALISATLDGLTAYADLLVEGAEAPTVTGVEVSPLLAGVAVGGFAQFQAIAQYSDRTTEEVTDRVTWTSSDETVAVVDNSDEFAGRVQGVAPGDAQITATLKEVASPASTFAVLPPEVSLERIDVSPAEQSAPVGTRVVYTALAFYTDGSTLDITVGATWESSDPAVVDINTGDENAGIALTLAEGSAEIRATFMGSTDTAAITVSPAILAKVVVIPALEEVPLGTVVSYGAVGIYSDLTYADLTELAAWSSSDEAVAIVGGKERSGLVSAVGVGTATISAAVGSVVGQSSLEVTPAALASIQITPAQLQKPVGTSERLTATAIYTDNTSQDVTAEVTWQSENDAVAQVSNLDGSEGLVSAIAVGNTTINAYYGGIAGEAFIAVTDPDPLLLTISPVDYSLPLGTQVQYMAVALFTDGSQSDVTGLVDWRSLDPNVAQLESGGPSGFFETTGVGSTQIEATYGSFSAFAVLEVTAAVLKSIQITPAIVVEPLGSQVLFTATARFSDGTNEDVTQEATWISSDDAVVTVSNLDGEEGLAYFVGVGTAQITASYGGGTGAVNVTGTSAVLTEINVTPVSSEVPAGVQVQYKAEGIYSDGSKVDISATAAWSSSDPEVAAIAPDGLADTFLVGDTEIRADFDGVRGSAFLTVSAAEVTVVRLSPAAPEGPKGTVVRFSAIAEYTDGTTQDVVSQSSWASSDTSTVFVGTLGEQAGVAQLLQVGNAQVTATYNGVSGAAQVVVTPAVLVAVQVSPIIESVARGLVQEFSAKGIFSDGSQALLENGVDWLSSDVTVATVDPTGLAEALSPGAVVISAGYNGFNGQALLEVNPATVVSIQVTPATLVEPSGGDEQMVATALLSDGTTDDVTDEATWTSSDQSIVAIDNFGENIGLASFLSPGIADVTATFDGVSDTVAVEVTAAVITEVQVSPALASVSKGLEVQYSAYGVYSDGSITSLGEGVSWNSSDKSVASINFDGLAEALGEGDTLIGATFEGVTGVAELGVAQARIVEIQVTPGNLVEPVGTSGFLTATALMSDGSSNDVTRAATWSSSDPSVASVETATEDAGFLVLLSTGEAQVSATLGEVNGSINVIVTPAVLQEILLSPTLYSMPLGQSVDFDAVGVFSDGSRTPIDSDVDWVSSDTTIVTIDSDGLADSVLEGTVTITAVHHAGITAVTLLEVTPAVLVAIEVSPQNPSLAKGTTLQLEVTGILSDASTVPITEDVVWRTTDTSIAVVDQGLVSGVNLGMATITAEVSSASTRTALNQNLTDSTLITVTEAVLREIVVSTDKPQIRAGEQTSFIATGEYSDGSIQDLTENVSWQSADTTVAIVSNSTGEEGVVYGEGVGQTQIIAGLDGFSGFHPITVTGSAITSIAVTPVNPAIATGLSQQFSAWAIYGDGSVEDVTASSVWRSSNMAVAEISSEGLATSAAAGVTTITATKETVSGNSTLTVDDTLPTAFDITPATETIPKGAGVQYTALLATGSGVSEITEEVVWSSSNDAVATISNAAGSEGYASGEEGGTVEIAAVYLHEPTDQLFRATATLEVLALSSNPLRVEVRPVTPAPLPVNSTLQFLLFGYWEISPGVELEVELTTDPQTRWKSLDKKVVSISNDENKGLATALKEGGTSIEGKFKAVDDTSPVTVVP